MIDDDHSARSIWETIGVLDLSLYDAKIAAVVGVLAETTQLRSCS